MSSKLPFQITIPHREHNCCCCTGQFDPEVEYHSLVQADENDQIIRRDFCAECWEKQSEKKGTHWHGRVPSKKEQKKQFVSMSVLDRAMEIMRGDVDESPEEAFFLALFLKQKRRLFQKGELRKDGGVYWIFECRDAAETFCLKRPLLGSVSVAEMQERVNAKLSGKEEVSSLH